MATDQRNLPSFFSGSTDFQTWVQGIMAQLTAVGMVQTGDTGQINGATVSLPGTTNTAAGYAVYRFNDSLQSTLGVFLKIEFGTGATTDKPSLWFTVGTNTNGAGTLTGQVGTRKQVAALASTTSGSTAASYCCYETGGGLALATNQASGANNNFIMTAVIDRSRDGSGTATADGIITWYAPGFNSGTNTTVGQIIPATGTVPSTATGFVSFAPSNTANSVTPSGANVVVAPVLWAVGKLLLTKMLHVARAADITSGVSVSVNTLGGTHTYMPIISYHSPISGVSGASEIALILWE